MKILYISDLDGTLLRSDERISDYTAGTINKFTRQGGHFSYATARSIFTASKVTAGLNTPFPVICVNGGFIIDSETKKILRANFLTPEEAKIIRDALAAHDVFPIVWAYVDGKEKFSYMGGERYITPAMRHFLDSRTGDPRCCEVDNLDALYCGDVCHVACMDTIESLSPINEIFKSDARFACVFQKETYFEAHYLEILPAKSTKGNAALQLKSMLGCDKLIVFGDNVNDMSMFGVADECYAVANAVPELKAIATAVIGSNDEDGVAKFIAESYNL